MKQLIIILFLVNLLSCTEEPSSSTEDSLVGHWNSYEWGTEQFGFSQNITNSLTVAYESGFSFHNDGTFSVRYFTPESGTWDPPTIEDPGTWKSGDAIGTYQFKPNTISLTYFPGTMDEFKLDLQLVKLDEDHLWFKHTLFGDEIEHHLVR